MIESLNGYHETVNFKDRPLFRLYHNDEPVDYPPHWHSNMEIIMPVFAGVIILYGAWTAFYRAHAARSMPCLRKS